MGRASALLRRVATPRVAAFAVLAVALGAYYAWHEQLVDLSKWWNVAFLALCLIPSIFALVYLALPYRTSHGLLLLALALLVLVVLLELAELQSLSSFAKLALMTTLGFWFLEYFESVLWVALVALLIPWVDAFSVWRGPTGHIVEEEPGLFDRVAFEFPHPGEPSAALLGPPDLLFFALFLAAAARWNLRVGWTFVALTLSLGLTLVIGVAVGVRRTAGPARARVRVPDPERGPPLARVPALAPRARRAGGLLRLMAQAARPSVPVDPRRLCLAQFRVLDQQSYRRAVERMTRLAAAPRPVQRVLGEAAANGVVEDVAAGVFQVRVPVDHAGVEPLLEEMAGSAVASVEPSGVSTVQCVHSA